MATARTCCSTNGGAGGVSYYILAAKAGFACSWRARKMALANALHGAPYASLSGMLVYVDFTAFGRVLIGSDWMG